MITVVTGLPRSGTTMMMRMLEAGGIYPYYDTSRPLLFEKAGVEYVNFNRILRETGEVRDLNTGWLDKCHGKAVKILHPANHEIPNKDYRFIWMDRKLKHMAQSQRKYGERSGLQRPSVEDLTREIRRARKAGKEKLREYPMIVVKFEEVLKNAKWQSVRVSAFLQKDMDLDAMAAVVVKRPKHCLPYMMEERLYI